MVELHTASSQSETKKSERKQLMKKCLTSILIFLCMILYFVPTTAFADSGRFCPKGYRLFP